ncbi:MAG: hypothetical protein KDB61_16285, partial [Planctomycetes bacterium]|nr:hypothetical protein [Planctomycetota bacterium]
MRRFLPVLAGLALLLVLWCVTRSNGTVDTATPAPVSSQETTTEPALQDVQTPDLDPPQREVVAPAGKGPEAPTITVLGRLVSETGDPLAGLTANLGEGSTEQFHVCASSDEGRFECVLPWSENGRYMLSVLATPRTQSLRQIIPDPQPGIVDLGDLICRQGSSISGRVLDLSGNPIFLAK